MNEINNPHDKFFKKVFSDKSNAQDFLLNYLPTSIVNLLDLTSLEYTKETFVDKHLAEYFSDLLCKIDLRDGSLGYIYFLFEHKSYQEPLTAFHILRYMVKMWDVWLRDVRLQEKSGRLPRFPVIIPMIVYHGEGQWRAGLNYKDLFHCHEEMACFIPDFQYLLWDASGYSDQEIKGEVMLRAALLALKYIYRKDLREHLPKILGLLRDLFEKQTGIEFIETLLRYLLMAAPKEYTTDADIKEAVVMALSNKGGEIMLTIADSLIEEGRKQGLEQGMQQGMQQGIIQNAREDIIDSLKVRFDIVPESMINTINEINDPEVLKALLRKAVKAASLDEFTQIAQSILK
jgi:predicted transposase/invertase (TIGR01784 family)